MNDKTRATVINIVGKIGNLIGTAGGALLAASFGNDPVSAYNTGGTIGAVLGKGAIVVATAALGGTVGEKVVEATYVTGEVIANGVVATNNFVKNEIDEMRAKKLAKSREPVILDVDPMTSTMAL